MIGVIGCARRRANAAFTPDDQDLIQQVADRAAISIENARLVVELNEANAETDVLYELTDAVNRAESLDGVYAPALSAISQQVRVARCALLLFDPDGVMRWKAWRGLSDAYRRTVEGHSPWRADETNATPIVIPDVHASEDLAAFRSTFDAERIAALAFIPMAHGGRLLGKFMLYSEEPRAFSASEVRLAQTIADQVAAAVAQKQTKAERERLIDELTRTVKLNELFAGILGHDLRNPLGAILMSAKVLSGKIKDEGQARGVNRILSAGNRMNRMITQLLDFTRVRAGGALPIDRARIDVATVFRQAIDELPEITTSRRVTLEQDGDTHGWWDADRLAQAASNLIGNAVRHGAAEAGVGVRIDGRDSSHITVAVTNAGTIPAVLLPIIFEPFQRGELRDRGGGLGLGLFITREIVTAHRGSLDVVSEGEGTTFTIRLPRAADGHPPPVR